MSPFGQRLDPQNAVVLTNIARIHIRNGSEEDLIAADEALRMAATCAQRSFVWWRALREELNTARGRQPLTTTPPPVSRTPSPALNFRQLQTRYQELKTDVERGLVDAQRRGYLIQNIVADLLTITFWSGDPIGSHHVHTRQVDAAFTYLGIRHRVEVKWLNHPLHQNDLDSLPRILQQAEVRGVVISMSGFVPETIEYARDLGRDHAILLVDDQEMDHVFSGRIRFESLIEWKLLHWRRSGNPYEVWSEAKVGSRNAHPECQPNA